MALFNLLWLQVILESPLDFLLHTLILFPEHYFSAYADLILKEFIFINVFKLMWWLFVIKVNLGPIASVLRPKLFVYISIYT